jgi:uncharacterized repeat protein (TIGR03803 family)
MKTYIQNVRLPALMTGMSLLLAGRTAAQTFITLHNFSETATNSQSYYTNSDGAVPEAGMVLLVNTLYGTAVEGTAGGWGTVFSVKIDGTGFTNLYNFTPPAFGTNSDGAFPHGGLILSGSTLYGTTDNGGSSGAGTIFSINLNDLSFTNLHNFTYSDGYSPSSLLLSTNETLYGATYGGGSSGSGTLFKINTDGSGFTSFYDFTATSGPLSTNSDGANPDGRLIVSGNFLYGTAYLGGRSGSGTVFKVNTGGLIFKTLHSFTALADSTNGDGANPFTGLVLSGNTLYGTTHDGGSRGNGTVFAVSTDGLIYTNLHSFTGYPSDGATPEGRLILFSNMLYGTTIYGGSSDSGMVFAINTDGTGLANLYNFTALPHENAFFYTNRDGGYPFAGLSFSQSDNMLYGTTTAGGISGAGTVFSLALPLPPLTIILSGTNAILTWPIKAPGVDYTGFVLQSTTNLVLPDWNNVDGPSPRTNAISGSQKFYHLMKEEKAIPL